MGFDWSDGEGRRVVADDETRTVTEWVDGEVVTVRDYTADEVAALVEQVAADVRLDDLEARVAALEALHTTADPTDPDDPAVPTWDDLVPAGWWYAGALLADVDGQVYRNISGSVLTTPPSAMPGGGALWLGVLFSVLGETPTDPDPEPEPPTGPEADPAYKGDWKPWTSGLSKDLYQTGDVVRHQETYWTATVGDNHWEPGIFGWTPYGS